MYIKQYIKRLIGNHIYKLGDDIFLIKDGMKSVTILPSEKKAIKYINGTIYHYKKLKIVHSYVRGQQ
uniref:Uncharacterized protein n=1 Tax=viral metagenome TaxID=1070528 RepID=A0A6H1ZB26_9ZZZZ